MKLSKLKDRKAISPVIATVILVAVAITIAVAVAYWMGGISSQYTKFEKIEVQSGYSRKVTNGWNVTLELKNSGTADATLNRVFINNKPLNASDTTGYGVAATNPWTARPNEEVMTDIDYDPGTTLTSGQSITVKIWIRNTYGTLTSGTTVDIKVHSAGGMDYIKLIELV
jgi:flagellin-like protein